MTGDHIHKSFFKLRITRMTFSISCMMIAIQIGFILLRWHTFPPKVPLYFSLPWGEDQLADTKYMFLFPLISVSILIVNTIVSAVLHPKEHILAALFTIATAISICIATIGILKIIFLLS